MLFLYVFSMSASLVTLVIGIFTRSAPRSLYFSLLTLAIFMLTLGFIIEVTAPDLETAVVAVHIQYLGAPFIAPLLLLFICSFCGIDLKKRILILLFILPVAAFILVQTWTLNGLFYNSLEVIPGPMISHLAVDGSVFHFISMCFNVIITVVADIILIYHLIKGDKVFRKQAAAIVAASVMPLIGTFSIILGVGAPYDLTPIYLGIACMLLSFSILGLGLYRVAPIAREQIVEKMHDGFIIIDNQGSFVYANVAAKHIIPELVTISVGTHLSEIEEIAWVCKSEETRGNEFHLKTPEGLVKHYRLSETSVKEKSKVIGRCIMIYDITEEKELLKEVSFLAERDTLTGLINRRTLFITGERLFKSVSARSANACMFMIDIDNFKTINDTYGHLKGDEVLRAVAETLSSRIRDMEIARYGGEEFCAFLTDISPETALDIARTMRERIEQKTFTSSGDIFNVTISVGIAFFDAESHNSFDMLMSDADAALYAAKRNGRNTIYVAKITPGKLVFECATRAPKH